MDAHKSIVWHTAPVDVMRRCIAATALQLIFARKKGGDRFSRQRKTAAAICRGSRYCDLGICITMGVDGYTDKNASRPSQRHCLPLVDRNKITQ